MPISAVKLRRDAENAKADLGLRAEVVAELLANHPGERELQLSPAVIAVLADRTSPQTALLAALKVAPEARAPALSVALSKLGPEPPPSIHVTRAYAELGRTEAATDSLHHELRWLAGQANLDTTVQSAFGTHILEVTALLGLPAARTWALTVVHEDKAHFDLLRQCIRVARIPEALARHRKLVHAVLDEAWLSYWRAQGIES